MPHAPLCFHQSPINSRNVTVATCACLCPPPLTCMQPSSCRKVGALALPIMQSQPAETSLSASLSVFLGGSFHSNFVSTCWAPGLSWERSPRAGSSAGCFPRILPGRASYKGIKHRAFSGIPGTMWACHTKMTKATRVHPCLLLQRAWSSQRTRARPQGSTEFLWI